ncbi:acetyltransferase [Lithospermum erythrorhizon]|uniref:Acetyltransferase n=1 Tax=Lithospermum erythrorhizon TaxID=34254 RepID=A0AAV3PK01_LITER
MLLPEMSTMAAAIGVSVAVLRFLLCFIATIPVGFLHRFAPGGATGRHLYAALSSAVLSYLSFGFSSNLHFLIPMLAGYGSMVVCRKYCGIIAFFLAMGYLIGCHVYYMSGDAWKEGGIDATGALMVITLKIISCSINYNDGLLKEENLREAQKKNRLLRLPSLLEYCGYCLCCGSHFAGPVYEMKDYLEWTERKGIWQPSEKGSSPSPLGATLRAVVQAAFCMGLYLYLVPHFPLSRFSEPLYQEWGFWKRLGYQYMSGFTARWKYYFIWSISEASIIVSGLGFSGWTNSSPPEPRWDRARNVDILGVELAKSSVQLPLEWNIQVSTWLRHCKLPMLEVRMLNITYLKGLRSSLFDSENSVHFNRNDSHKILGIFILYLIVEYSNVIVRSLYSTDVYERLVCNGQKAGFFQLLATQTVSAVWHGLYPGYLLFFVQSALMIAGSRVLYRWQQASSLALFKNLIILINFMYTLLVLNYSCVGFLVLSLHETLAAYGSVYYIGTMIPVALILGGKVIKPARPARSKAQKEQ